MVSSESSSSDISESILFKNKKYFFIYCFFSWWVTQCKFVLGMKRREDYFCLLNSMPNIEHHVNSDVGSAGNIIPSAGEGVRNGAAYTVLSEGKGVAFPYSRRARIRGVWANLSVG